MPVSNHFLYAAHASKEISAVSVGDKAMIRQNLFLQLFILLVHTPGADSTNLY